MIEGWKFVRKWIRREKINLLFFFCFPKDFVWVEKYSKNQVEIRVWPQKRAKDAPGVKLASFKIWKPDSMGVNLFNSWQLVVFQPRSTSPEKRESSPRRDSDHFYNDDEYFKSEVSHAETKSPTLPKKPPVSAAMKMEELNEFYEEFDGESILEYFDGEENDSHMLNETDSFYFYDDGQGMSLKYKSP